MLSKVSRQHTYLMNGDSPDCQEVWVWLLENPLLFCEWEFRGNSLQSWHGPAGVGMCKNRVTESRVCGGVCVCKRNGFPSMKLRTDFPFLKKNSSTEV